MQDIEIIKIGGNIVNDSEVLNKFLGSFNIIKSQKILVHGGGILATTLAEKLHVKQTIIEGRRVTDEPTLDIATMVYAGKINKKIMATLQSLDCNAVGLTGADGNLVCGHKRQTHPLDYGFVGDINTINTNFLQVLLNNGFVPIICPIIHDKKGQLLNTNADTIASEIAILLSKASIVNLTICFEKLGVLLDINDENTLIKELDLNLYESLKMNKQIANGMIPKLQNAFSALGKGVQNVSICHAKNVNNQNECKGTKLLL